MAKHQGPRQQAVQHSTRVALIASLAYAITAGLWILFSDTLLADPSRTALRQLGFILVSSLVIFIIVRFQRIRRSRAEQALRESEMNFRLFMDHFPGCVTIQDADGTNQYGNAYFARLVGKEPAELIGKCASDFMPEVYAKLHEEENTWVKAAGQMMDFTQAIEGKDGTTHWYTIKFPIPREEGEPLIGSMSLDVTEQREATHQLSRNEALLRLVLDTNPNAIFVKDDKGRFQLANKAFADLYHMAPEELLGKTSLDLAEAGIISRDAAAFYHDADLTFIHENRDMPLPERSFALPGEAPRYFQSRTAMVMQPGESPMMLGIGTDITERVKAESAFIESQRQLETLMSNLPGMAYRCQNDEAWTMEFVSEGCLTLTGYPSSDLLKNRHVSYNDIIHPDDRESVRMAVSRGVAEHRPFEMMYRIRAGGDQLKWVWERGRGIWDEAGELLFLEGFIWDITERKQFESLLEERARQLALLNKVAEEINAVLDPEDLMSKAVRLIEQSFHFEHVSLFVVNQDRKVLTLVEQTGKKEILPAGYEIPLDRGLTGWAASHKERVLVAEVQDDPRYITCQASTIIHSEMVLPVLIDGEAFAVIDLQSVERDAFDENDVLVMETLADTLAIAIKNARLYRALSHYSEVLERAVTLRTSELVSTKSRIEAILNSSPDGILLIDQSGVIETANPAIRSLFDMAGDVYEGMSLYSLVDEQSLDEVRKTLESVIADGKPKRAEIIARSHLNRSFDAEVAFAPLSGPGLAMNVVCMLRDISTLKEAERVREDFASNVSHELRTPITGLRLNYSLLKMDPGRSDLYTERIGREIERLNMIIEDLLRLSRMDREQIEFIMKPTDLTQLGRIYFTDREPLAAEKGLTMTLALEPIPTVMADEGLLGQVLSIFLTNAMSYTPPGGTITLMSTSNDSEAGLAISDTGPGILPDEIADLFRRFYRGKAGRESGTPGTGLGLAIAREIITRHNGRIEVTSEGIPGKGTTFTFWLPVIEGEHGSKH